MPGSIYLLHKQRAFEFPAKTMQQQWVLWQGNCPVTKVLKFKFPFIEIKQEIDFT